MLRSDGVKQDTMRNILLSIQVYLFLLFAFGYSSNASSENTDIIKRKFQPSHFPSAIVFFPGADEIKTIEVGENLIWKWYVTVIPAIAIEKDLSFPKSKQDDTDARDLTITAGTYVAVGKDEEGIFYEAKSGKYKLGDITFKNCGIYVGGADLESLRTETYCAAKTQLMSFSKLRNGISFVKTTHHEFTENSFKKELVYNGISQNVISILYREFINDMARPAFYQDLKYDLTEVKTFGYRGARFEVIKASNQEMTYRMIKPLN